MSSGVIYQQNPDRRPSVVREQDIEEDFIAKLEELKYTYRKDIRDRASLEANFRTKFEALNRVRLTDGEFARLLDELISPDVFKNSVRLREKNDFTRDDGTPLSYTLVNIRDWCKNDFEVVHQLRINTDYSHHRYDVIVLINGVPVAQVELKTLGVSPRRAMQQIADYKADPGNGYTRTLLCFVQHFEKGKRQNVLTAEHIDKIVETYQQRPKNPIPRYARRVGMDEIEKEGYNLNISRYISTAVAEAEVDLKQTHRELVDLEQKIQAATLRHNTFLEELNLPPLPGGASATAKDDLAAKRSQKQR